MENREPGWLTALACGKNNKSLSAKNVESLSAKNVAKYSGVATSYSGRYV
jgi:hypothetical protein